MAFRGGENETTCCSIYRVTHLTSLTRNISDFRKWVEGALSAVRDARVGFAAGDLAWRAHAADVLAKAGVAPIQLRERLAAMLCAHHGSWPSSDTQISPTLRVIAERGGNNISISTFTFS